MLYFIDCEASSLNHGSYPIEIAWVSENGQGESYLIRPQATWTDWDDTAEAVHGIARATLYTDGKPARWVAQRALEVLSNKQLVSDNPAFEQSWLGLMLASVDHGPLPFIDLNEILTNEIQRLLAINTALPDSREWHRQSRYLLEHGQAMLSAAHFRAIASSRVQHRALPDAQRLWQVWRDVKQGIDQIVVG